MSQKTHDMGTLGHDEAEAASGQGHATSTIRLEGNFFGQTESRIVTSREHCTLARSQF